MSDPGGRRPRWWARSVGWALAACVLGPLALGVGLAAVGTVLRARSLGEAVGAFLGGAWIVVFFGTFAAVVFALPVYLPLLLAWGWLGPRLGRLETTRPGLALGTLALAAPGAAAAAAVYGGMEPPFGYRGAELARYAAAMWGGLWAGLLLPRLAVRALAPGAFARGPTPVAERGAAADRAAGA